MSRQPQETSDEDTEWPDDEPDNSEPAPKRKAELRAAYKANMAVGKGPYEDVEIYTLGELLWIQNERGWRMDDLDLETKPAELRGIQCSGTNLAGACLTGSDLSGAFLLDAILRNADLTYANLSGADLDHTDLRGARMVQANLRAVALVGANLKGADLDWAIMDVETRLNEVLLDDYTRVGSVKWNGVSLTGVQWDQAKILAEESEARNPINDRGKNKPPTRRVRDYERAVMAYRRLATELRNQGLNEHGDRYAYHARLCQRVVLRRQSLLRRSDWLRTVTKPPSIWWRVKKFAAYLGSWLLDLLSGYGYEPIRTVFAYLSVVFAFAALYVNLSPASHPHLTYLAAFVMSVASFHGRGFFPAPTLPLDSPLVVAGAVEAIFGLIIEASFIATFTQRFFAR